ncbi:MAG: hypothetical protein HFF50_10555 [Lawsonibacter sp.]|nr:hypothetical protein [Lawsonibacter sp.]
MGFWVGKWLHDPPSAVYDSTGKRAVLKHLCFGPVETQIWYVSADGQYYRELHIMEGPQAGDLFLDRINRAEMLEAITAEIDLCQKNGETELAALFQAEKDHIQNDL